MKNNIKQVRESLGLTQRELADRMGITQESVARMESGRHVLRASTLDQIAKALSVHWTQLLEPDAVKKILDHARDDLAHSVRRARGAGLTQDDVAEILKSA